MKEFKGVCILGVISINTNVKEIKSNNKNNTKDFKYKSDRDYSNFDRIIVFMIL